MLVTYLFMRYFIHIVVMCSIEKCSIHILTLIKFSQYIGNDNARGRDQLNLSENGVHVIHKKI